MAWTLRDDRDGSVIAEGSEKDVKDQWPIAVALGMWEGNLYAESPDGEQYAWNKHTGEWDRL